MGNLLELHDVCYNYHTLSGETPALTHINLSVKKGDFVAIVGPSGCGKSTLLSLIAGLIKPESGSIQFPEFKYNSDIKPPIGYMLQNDFLLEWRTIYKNVLLGLEINHKLPNKYFFKKNDKNSPSIYKDIDTMLRKYDLLSFKDKKPSELSGGMRQRAALVRTLSLSPDLLLLDEPFSALDYQTRLSVSSDICSKIRKENKTAILVTHDLSEAIRLADIVYVLSKRPGTIIKELPIKLTISPELSISSRNAPEFPKYFEILWEALNESK
ncbi:MAG TPA: ATP-binding cassette domain-containing protein [Lachnospiraceae bacterium]|nr:ATP-binding cassette domain-containing protein [Lachnospiraceae bacterium]